MDGGFLGFFFLCSCSTTTSEDDTEEEEAILLLALRVDRLRRLLLLRLDLIIAVEDVVLSRDVYDSRR